MGPIFSIFFHRPAAVKHVYLAIMSVGLIQTDDFQPINCGPAGFHTFAAARCAIVAAVAAANDDETALRTIFTLNSRARAMKCVHRKRSGVFDDDLAEDHDDHG